MIMPRIKNEVIKKDVGIVLTQDDINKLAYLSNVLKKNKSDVISFLIQNYERDITSLDDSVNFIQNMRDFSKDLVMMNRNTDEKINTLNNQIVELRNQLENQKPMDNIKLEMSEDFINYLDTKFAENKAGLKLITKDIIHHTTKKILEASNKSVYEKIKDSLI